jgi:hypothetical protein
MIFSIDTEPPEWAVDLCERILAASDRTRDFDICLEWSADQGTASDGLGDVRDGQAFRTLLSDHSFFIQVRPDCLWPRAVLCHEMTHVIDDWSVDDKTLEDGHSVMFFLHLINILQHFLNDDGLTTGIDYAFQRDAAEYPVAAAAALERWSAMP